MWKVLWTCIFRNKQLTSGRYVLKLKIKNIDDFRLDGCQAAATRESITADVRHTVGDGDGCQAAAVPESTIADARHTVWDGDGGQAAAARESRIADSCQATGDGDGGQTTTAVVFASRFISTICVLNGRKVMPRILKKPKKINI